MLVNNGKKIILKAPSRIGIYKNIMDGSFRLDPEKIAAYKFAPITSVGVERSFSTYINVFWMIVVIIYST